MNFQDLLVLLLPLDCNFNSASLRWNSTSMAWNRTKSGKSVFKVEDLYLIAHLPGQGGQLSKSPSILFLVILVTLMPGWSTVSLPLVSRLARILLLL